MEAGKLHQNKHLYWLLFPSEETVVAAADHRDDTSPAVHGYDLTRYYANFWSKQLSCKVSFIEPSSMFVVLEQGDKFCRILTGEGVVGWIQLAEWCRSDIVEAYGNR
jgi:hypothetical protein